MAEAATSAGTRPAPQARAAGLAFAGFAAADCSLAARAGPAPWFDGAALVFLVHVGLSLFEGDFGRPRAATWLLLVGAWTWWELSAFVGHVLPWGQLSFWFAALLADTLGRVPVVGGDLVAWLWNGGLSSARLPPAALLFAAALGLDFAVLHRPRRRAEVAPALLPLAFGAAAACAAVGAGALPLDRGSAALGFAVVASWFELPLYALLRAVPDKAAGIGLMFAAMLVFAAGPWIGAARCRAGPWRLPLGALCAGLTGAWAALFWAGGQDPEVAELPARAAAAYTFGFFALVPALASLSPR